MTLTSHMIEVFKCIKLMQVVAVVVALCCCCCCFVCVFAAYVLVGIEWYSLISLSDSTYSEYARGST